MLRYAIRVLCKTPILTSIVIATIALGVGASTAIFTIVYATQLAPLPFPEQRQLVSIWSLIDFHKSFPPPKEFLVWQGHVSSFQALSGYAGDTFDIGLRGQTENIFGMRVGRDYYRTLGMSFVLGRDFLPTESQPGQNHVVILTHALWKHLGSDHHIIGRSLQIDEEPYTVVGVLKPGIADRDVFQLAVPLVFTPEEIQQNDIPLVVVGRLKSGVSAQRAEQELGALIANLPAGRSGHRSIHALLSPLKDSMESMSSDMKRELWFLLAAVGLLLLIACVNVANLLLARGGARQKEFAIRFALGARPANVFSELLKESILLGLSGGVIGIGLGCALLRGLLATAPPFTLPWEADTSLNLPILGFSLVMSIGSGILFGFIPAWRASRATPADVLRGQGRHGGWRGLFRPQRALVIGELSLALTLLSATALVFQSFLNLLRVDAGIRTDHVLTFSLSDPGLPSSNPAKIGAYFRQMLSSIEAVPGVIAASAQTGTPLFPTGHAQFTIASPLQGSGAQLASAAIRSVTPGYFGTFGISILAGRRLTDEDGTVGERVALVNEEFVHSFLQDGKAMGQTIFIPGATGDRTSNTPPTEWHIVGVYHDVRSGSMRKDPPEILVPFYQSPPAYPTIAVRTAEPPESMEASITAAIHKIDHTATMARPRTMEQIRDQVLGYDRFTAVLFVGFGAIALLLVTVGVYGLVSFTVQMRAREIAVRMAVGANRAHVVTTVLRDGLVTTLWGLGVGAGGGWFATEAMRSTVFGIAKTDFSALVIVAVLLMMTSAFATLIPANRAVATDPMQVLRAE
jgi:putative ABC transport system permease protein